MVYIYGIHPVIEAIKSDKDISEVWFLKKNNRRIDDIQSLCQSKQIPYSFKNKDDFSHLEGLDFNTSQGVIALLSKKDLPLHTLKSYFKKYEHKINHLFLMLDSITDPRNFGAIIRTCDYFSVSAVITAQDKSAPITATVYKTSSGALAYVPQIQVTNLSRTLEELKKKRDFWIYGMDLSGDRRLYDCDFKGNVVIVLGAEDKGMKRLVKESCDFLVKIECLGNVDSLNVSVAGGIALYEAMKQRANVHLD